MDEMKNFDLPNPNDPEDPIFVKDFFNPIIEHKGDSMSVGLDFPMPTKIAMIKLSPELQ